MLTTFQKLNDAQDALSVALASDHQDIASFHQELLETTNKLNALMNIHFLSFEKHIESIRVSTVSKI